MGGSKFDLFGDYIDWLEPRAGRNRCPQMTHLTRDIQFRPRMLLSLLGGPLQPILVAIVYVEG